MAKKLTSEQAEEIHKLKDQIASDLDEFETAIDDKDSSPSDLLNTLESIEENMKALRERLEEIDG